MNGKQFSFLKTAFITCIIFSSSCFFAKKIVVTGGAGFIGSHLAEKLLLRGDEVVIIDNFNNYYDPQLKRNNIAEVQQVDSNEALRVYTADICDKEKLEEVFQKEQPDIICHLAAYAGVRRSIKEPELYLQTNIIGTTHILEMAKKYTIPHVVIASSSSVYGECKEVPFKEEAIKDKQSSPYGMSKRATELIAYVYNHLYGISCTCLRFFTVYGPRGRVDMAPFIFLDLIHNDKPITVFGDGSAIRDFTYIDDIVDGILKSIDTPLGFEILNLGRGKPIVLRDFIKTIEGVIGKRAIITYAPSFAGDVSTTHANITKSQKLIGYNPQTSVEEGMRKMYEWYINYYAK